MTTLHTQPQGLRAWEKHAPARPPAPTHSTGVKRAPEHGASWEHSGVLP
jgi:hypothetical protein